jgi:diacylglycerol kinase (ATP)
MMTELQGPYKGKTGFARVWAALFYSLAGLRTAYASEAAFRQELWLGVGLTVIALLLPVTGMHRALLLASVLIVLIVELLNSAIEAIVDRVTVDRDELAKAAKDMGSAAVLLSLLLCVVVWLGVLGTLV